MKTLFSGTLLCCLLLPGAALADQAVIFGIYEECAAVSSTVFVRSDRLNSAQSDDIAAQAEAAGSGLGFDRALPLIIASLEENGVSDIEIQRQGDCNRRQQEHFLEAVIDYCNDSIVHAQVLVDGKVFYQRGGPKLDLGEFVSTARQKLDAANIFGDPRISLNNSTDCPSQTNSG